MIEGMEFRTVDRSQSIERRLPLLFCILLVAVTGGLAWLALDAVYTLAHEVAEERLQRIAERLAETLEQAPESRYGELRPIAIAPEVATLMERLATTPAAELPIVVQGEVADSEPDSTGRPAPPPAPEVVGPAVTTLFRGVTASSLQIVFVGLVDEQARLRLAVLGRAGLDTPLPETIDLPDPAGPPGRGITGPFVATGTQVYYDSFVPLEGVAGHAVQRRRVTSNPGGVRLIRGLIGAEGSFLLGNVANDVWTDLQDRRGRPPGEVVDAPAAMSHPLEDSDGATWFGSSLPVAGTPWAVWVGQPDEAVLEPARNTLTWIGVVALATLLAGFAAALFASRRITSPLNELTVAAVGIARGDYERRVDIGGRDELGVLAAAFNAMAARVQDASSRLEERVALQTEQLSEAQAELFRKEKLAMLGQLAGGVGHELRNPLGVINNAVYLLKMRAEELPEKSDRYIEMIERQVEISEKIIDDLLGLARVRDPERETVPVAELCDEAVDRAALPAEVAIEIDLPPGLPPLSADRLQIGQVLVNLLGNANQAMDGAGRLWISADRENGMVHLRVSDSGPGVPAEHAEKIFEPLYTTRARGIGLGLSLSRSLANVNGGELWLQEPSAGQGGAVFVLSVPVEDETSRTTAGGGGALVRHEE